MRSGRRLIQTWPEELKNADKDLEELNKIDKDLKE